MIKYGYTLCAKSEHINIKNSKWKILMYNDYLNTLTHFPFPFSVFKYNILFYKKI